jgi:ubiquinone/menaquinone biosynthesis C-methylase UbiE
LVRETAAVAKNRHLEEVRRNWERYGSTDPMFGVLTVPGKEGRWDETEFYQYGRSEIISLYGQLALAEVTPPTDRVLDFGCGVGRLSFALAERFDEVDGVDISPSMLAFAMERNTYGDRCRFHLYEGGDLDMFANDTFGMVVCLMTLQHVPPASAERYVAEMVRVTRPGGIVAVQFPEKRAKAPSVAVWIKGSLLAFYDYRIRGKARMEMHGRTAEDVARIMRDAGAKVVAAIPDRRCGEWGTSFLHVAVKAG